MKSEKNEKVNKHDYAISAIHKVSICKILYRNSLHREGMTAKMIHARMNYVTLETVYNLLKDLVRENKIFKSKQKYSLNLFFDDGWYIFARFLEELPLRKYDLKLPLQKIHSNQFTFSDNLENEIHYFGNFVGAFILYILIESLRPNERMIGRETRDQIWESFLQQAVSMPNLLQRFSEQLPEMIDFYRVIIGGDNLSFDKLFNAYNNVYGNFSKSMDESFRYYISSLTPVETCDHEWLQVKVHKLGDRHLCRKCLGLANEEDFEPLSI